MFLPWLNLLTKPEFEVGLHFEIKMNVKKGPPPEEAALDKLLQAGEKKLLQKKEKRKRRKQEKTNRVKKEKNGGRETKTKKEMSTGKRKEISREERHNQGRSRKRDDGPKAIREDMRKRGVHGHKKLTHDRKAKMENEMLKSQGRRGRAVAEKDKKNRSASAERSRKHYTRNISSGNKKHRSRSSPPKTTVRWMQ